MIFLYLSKPLWQIWTKTKLCIVIKNKSISNSNINYNSNTNCDNCWNVIFCLYQTDKQTYTHPHTHTHITYIYTHTLKRTYTHINTHTNVVSSASESRRKEEKFLTLKYFFPSLSHKWRRGDGSPSSPNSLPSVQF